jgi:hypothetical protein
LFDSDCFQIPRIWWLSVSENLKVHDVGRMHYRSSVLRLNKVIFPSASEKFGETRQIIVPWKNVDRDNWFPSTHDNPWVLNKVLVNRFP